MKAVQVLEHFKHRPLVPPQLELDPTATADPEGALTIVIAELANILDVAVVEEPDTKL